MSENTTYVPDGILKSIQAKRISETYKKAEV